MASPNLTRLALLVALTAIAGCTRDRWVDLGPIQTASGAANTLAVFVEDDAGYLNSTLCCSTLLVGARVEILDGPAAGRSATADARGIATFTNLGPEPVRVRATYGDYEPAVVQFYPNTSSIPAGHLTLGRTTHILSGFVTTSSSHAAIAGARVEITSGPNAGRFALTGDDGSYRLDGLVTSARLTLQITKAGYVDRTGIAPGFDSELFTHNEFMDYSLTPSPQ